MALSVLLIPSGGDSGAAWSYVASLYVVAALSFLVLERQLGRGVTAAPTGVSEAVSAAELPG